MAPLREPADSRQREQLLYLEARLLDDWDLDAWLAL